MARRISTLEAELVFLEDKFAAIRAAEGEPDASTLDLYGRLADRQRRLADPLGWHRTARPIGPSLSTIIESGTWTGAEDESEPAAGGQP
jgi:hypothetical protein